jgi:hypothetical protein
MFEYMLVRARCFSEKLQEMVARFGRVNCFSRKFVGDDNRVCDM